MKNRFDDLTNPEIYSRHAVFWGQCANQLLANQGRRFVYDKNNKWVLRGLLYYFNRCPLAETDEELKHEVKGESVPMFQLGKNIMLCGGVGCGKTLIMDTFAMYLRLTNNPMAFRNVSVTEMMNYYKVNDHLDLYTYNTGKNSFEGNPIAYCLNDVGLQTQKYFGMDTQLVIDEYFHARNEIWTQHGVHSHITTNLPPKKIKEVFKDEYDRLNDRWKSYNVIHLKGESRR